MDSFQDSQVPNREQLLRMAIQTAKQGNRDGARVMFQQVLREDRRNERAMVWMAKLASSQAERKEWLERVLTVNPNNDVARDALRKMTYSSNARDNRILVIFGVIALILIITGIVVFVVLSLPR